MSSKARKAAALQALKERRTNGLGISRTEEYEIADEADIYDKVDAKEYKEIVEKRRQREDFVVDDDGLGYYDDGEEFMDRAEEEDNTRSRKRAGPNANLTKDALKRARKTNALLAEKRKEGDAAQSNSMWDFVKRGTAAASVGATKKAEPSRKAANLESLLDELDTPSVSRRQPRPRRAYGGRAAPRSAGPSSRRNRAYHTPTSSRNNRRDYHEEKEQPPSYNDEEQDDNLGWEPTEMEDVQSDTERTPEEHHSEETSSPLMNTPSPPEKNEKRELAADSPPRDTVSKKAVTTEESVDMDVEKKDEKEKEPEVSAPRSRLRFKPKNKLRKITVEPLPEPQTAPTSKDTTSKSSSVATTAPSFVDTTSSSFKPDVIASEEDSPLSAAAAAAAAANLESVLQRQGDEQHLDMYVLDVTEKNGVIHVFGKVEVKHGVGKDTSSTYVSCCAVVKNNMRNLFVLPRRKEDGEFESILNVHTEMKSVLQPSCIPLMEGASWGGKPVKRQYAFDDPSIPREETQYLKVVYDAKYPVPSNEVCTHGGKNFEKILGACATPLETFIVKRKLMGPCWIRIKNPASSPSPHSWCKVEVVVNNPKDITRLDLIEGCSSRPAPPVVTVSLKFKTIVNPKTHKAEIVSVSAVCHKKVLLDSASDDSARHMTQLSLIRPLGLACADSANVMPQFPRDFDQEVARNMPQLKRMHNERALLSRLFTQLGSWDPDVLVGHNAWGFDMGVLLSRCVENKVPIWSKIGRLRKMQMPSRNNFTNGKDWAIVEALSGRLLCDTYVSAKELLRETMYTLTNLSATQLKTDRKDIEQVDIPQWFNCSKSIIELARHTLNDAQLVQKLMFKLQILPLTKQLTCIAGNLWSRTLKGNRAERNEFLLLHEFHRLKYVVPEKKSVKRGNRDAEGEGKGAKYSGGLVLEPKKGFYDSFILLLDFNSLYPSLIQEYNLCFTTMKWADYKSGGHPSIKEQIEGEDGAVDEVPSAMPSAELPPLPDESMARGVLPRVIKSLVEKRRAVKKLLKNETNPDKKEELDIRQKAIKLTANSMYGCLGFSNSRFYAQPIAALITAMGRETLQRSVEIAQETVGLEVIYGDTDSIMINTRITDVTNLKQVYELGEKVKREVNRLYRTLELDLDGIFRSMLLLKKKKYAAITVSSGPDGQPTFGKEMKGLDLVRRDWCVQSKDSGRYVLDRILSGDDREAVIEDIHAHLEELARKMRNSELTLEKYVITKGLNKHPNDYPDANTQAHVHVAKMMLKANRPVNTGDHIQYVITEGLNEAGADHSKKAGPVAERARHPEEIQRSSGVLKPDVEWYLKQQILPPISRLCEPIEGMSQSILAEKLGLDASHFAHVARSNGIEDEELVDYTPASSLPDEERFKDVEKLTLLCSACNEVNDFPGVLFVKKGSDSGSLASGFECVNPDCPSPHLWGKNSHVDCMSMLSNRVAQLVQRQMCKYYRYEMQCEDPTCGLKTRQLSVAGALCLRRGCSANMHPVYSEKALHTQLKYLDTLFDIDHACQQLEAKKKHGTKAELLKNISKTDKLTWDELHSKAEKYMKESAYNWVSPSLWAALFSQAAASVPVQ